MGVCLCMATASIMNVECMPYHVADQPSIGYSSKEIHWYSVVRDADDAIHPKCVHALGHPDEEVDDLIMRESTCKFNRRRRTQIRQ